MTQFTPLANVRQSAPSPSRHDITSVLLGPSVAMAQLWSQLRRLAPHIRCLLLTGEPGCGQEAIARVLLELSPQRGRTFFTLTTAEVETRLLHRNGLSSLPLDAFVFLPEIDRFSLAAQTAILQLMRMRRGRSFTVIASAREDLSTLASLGRFSTELAHALASVTLAVPALRERKEDLPVLLTSLMTNQANVRSAPAPQLSKDFLEAAMRHCWAGNLDELSTVVSNLLSSAPLNSIVAADFATALNQHRAALRRPEQPVMAATRMVPLDTVMQEHVNNVLKACRGNKLRASEVLGISRSTLYRMLDTAGLSGDDLTLAN